MKAVKTTPFRALYYRATLSNLVLRKNNQMIFRFVMLRNTIFYSVLLCLNFPPPFFTFIFIVLPS